MINKLKINLIAISVSSLLLVGCGGAKYTPENEQSKTVEKLPTLVLLQHRVAPKPTNDNLIINIPYVKSEVDSGDFVSRPIISNKSYPSVILNIPADISKKNDEISASQKRTTNNSVKDSIENKPEQGQIFSTANYYNQAEQEVEKAMMRKGFNVLDRAKFEAKLRDLRDSKQNDRLSESARTIQKALRKEYEKGDLDLEEFQDKMTRVEETERRSSSGKKRWENEMIDISEVIRAAQSGKVKADYLLQINKMDVKPSYDRTLDIYKFAETKSYLDQHPDLKIGNEKGKIPRSIPRPWYRALFNAKLIDISNGKIAWIGNHSVESNTADKNGIEIRFNIIKSVKNENDISIAITQYNQKLQYKHDELTQTNRKLSSLYNKENESKDFKNTIERDKYISNLKSDINKIETSYSEKLKSFENLINNKPKIAYKKWDFKYDVGEAIITPALISNKQNSLQMKEKIQNHKNNLIREVTSSLISTIDFKSI